jgi:nucleotide-binding universal stress UspA family protein
MAGALLPHSRSAISVASIISVVASEPHEHYRRHIIVGIDNSLTSKAALEWAAKHLYRTGDKFHLVHIIPEPPTLHPWPGVYVPPDDALEREEFHDATAMVRAAFAPIVNQHMIPTDVHLIVAADSPGSIAALLLEKQQELEAAALVVASHGKQALQEFWTGSVTCALLRRCPAPLVVYRQQQQQQQC